MGWFEKGGQTGIDFYDILLVFGTTRGQIILRLKEEILSP
jgi:hypothetical protein